MRVFPVEATRFSGIYVTNKRDLDGGFIAAKCQIYFN